MLTCPLTLEEDLQTMEWVEQMVDLVDGPQFGGNSIIANKSKTFEETLDHLVGEDVNMGLLDSKALLDSRTVEDTRVVAPNLNPMERVLSRLLEIVWK